MLPRIASLESEFTDALQRYVQLLSRSDGLMREIRAHVIHEGTASAIQRSPVDTEKTKMFVAEAEATMRLDEMENVDVNYILSKAAEIAAQFGRKFNESLFQTMEDATAKTGQRVDARGTPLTNEIIMEMLSKMSIDFEKSQHGDITIVTAPQMLPRFQALERELNDDPELRKRMNDLMDQKRNEFREREINRNLAG